MNKYAVSLDLTVEAESKEQAWNYAEALSVHMKDGLMACPECAKDYANNKVECGNISEAELCDEDEPICKHGYTRGASEYAPCPECHD